MSYIGKPNRAQLRRAAHGARRDAPNFKPWKVVEGPPPNSVDKADVKFFRRFPDRTIRMRLASRVEVQQIRTNHPHLPATPTGWRWFALVRGDAHGVSCRQSLVAPAETDCDLSEAEAQAKWDEVPLPADLEACDALAVLAKFGGGCIALHLSVGEGSEAYPNEGAARQAVDAFTARVGLPLPAIFGSGTSISVLYPFPGGYVPGGDLVWIEIIRAMVCIFGLRVVDVTVGDASAALMALQEVGK